MFIYIIVISKQNRQTDVFLLLTGTLNHTIPKNCAFITSVHFRLLSVRCDNEQGRCWGWSVAKVWGFGGSLRTSSCLEDPSKRRNGTEKHRRAAFSQDFHAPFHCKICMLSIRHTSQGDQDFFPPSCPWCCFDNTVHFKHAFHMWVHLTIPLWRFMHTMTTEPRGFKWRVSLRERVAVNYYSQFARG